jgi:hypothetical protein
MENGQGSSKSGCNAIAALQKERTKQGPVFVSPGYWLRMVVEDNDFPRTE